MDLYSSPMVERIIPGRKLNVSTPLLAESPGEARLRVFKEPTDSKWVSPTRGRKEIQDLFPKCPESSIESSSVISLDFGLISPKKTWCSPPQRIERSQNREWSSPHRVIDRPNPENSPGNWISMKESRLTVQHSPGVKGQPCETTTDFSRPDPGPRPISQTTYTLPETVPRTRKTTVLSDYDPERGLPPKKRTGEPLDCALLPGNDKIRRVVNPNGHVVKISTLGDFAGPVFGKLHEKGEAGEKENTEHGDKPIRSGVVISKRTKVSMSSSPPAALRPQAKKKKEEGGTGTRVKSTAEKETDAKKPDDEEITKEEGKDEKGEDLTNNTQKMLMDLQKILRGPEEETEKEKNPPVIEKPKLKKQKPCPKTIEEKQAKETPEKRKRNVDPKAVQDYIKSQKQKRLEQVKTEKKTKDAEKEARKKKLEELRIKTLKLAAQSKKKKSPEKSIKVVEPGTEDDVTISLGLKQIKPKVSYNESISKLRKKQPQQKPQLEVPKEETAEEEEEVVEEGDEDEEDDDKTLENVETIQPEKLKKPEETVELMKPSGDLNETLKKLAETLHLKIEEKEKRLRSRPMSLASKSVKDSLSQVPSQESVKTNLEDRPVVTVDLDTIRSLKDDIKKISENFKVLHGIILDKTKTSPREVVPLPLPPPKPREEDAKDIPGWLKTITPRPHPYNVLTAFCQKVNITASVTSNKYESDFEELSVPITKKLIPSVKSTSEDDTSEENYFTLKDDSGSVLSSSILDSEKQSVRSVLARNTSGKTSTASSIPREITSEGFDSTPSKLSTDKENFILVTPDIKLISNDLHEEKLNNYTKNLNAFPKYAEELNNSEKSLKEQRSDSTITEMIDNLSENDRSSKSVKSTNERAVQRIEEGHMRRSFFQPEMLHLQFQAELTLLETFQQSLSHFLESERLKTLSEVNKIVYEKAINTEKAIEKEDQAVQTTFLKETTSEEEEDTKSVKTEINLSEDEEGGKSNSTEISEKLSSSSKETVKHEETLDFSNGHAGISIQMLNGMMKDEELRSEHQLALIRLREKALTEKVKAELTFLEMRKRALKERGGDEEVSAIKKKQRGILLKYQSEKEEIERLKKMHQIASEERRIMIKQQKQIRQMQISTKDMIIKLKKGERSPQRKTPLKPRTSFSSQSEIQEDIAVVMSESILTESSDQEVSSRSILSEDESDTFRRTKSEGKVSHSYRNYKPRKSLLELDKYPRKRHSVEELLSWTKRLEEKENRLKELEQETTVKNKGKTLKPPKISMRDRSTSPFQFQESIKTISEVSPTVEGTETKKSSTISEAIESNSKTEEKTESVAEKIQSSASEDIPEQFSKKTVITSTSRTTEYNSESFESPSSSEAPKTKPETPRSGTTSSHKGIAIKMSLSPRMQSPRRRYSSGSDDSLNLSHTETASEQSDLESRIAALHEQLRKRKLEAERLRREQKKAQRERLKVKEQSLLKQIQAYDAYIQKKKQELEREYEHSIQGVMKPLIKQPKVAEKSGLKPVPSTKTKSEEIIEQIKESSESIKEESESVKEQIEEEAIESILEMESSAKEMKSTSFSESLPEQEGSQSESEEQSISVKTTLHSPEKMETVEEETQTKETIDEDGYQFDSFESDPEGREEDQKDSIEEIEPPEEEEETTTNEEIPSESVKTVEEDERKSEKAEKIADSIIVELILESLKVFSTKKTEAERKLAEESKLSLEALSSFLAKEIISEAVDDMLKIYNRKTAPEAASPERITSEIRRRISEIMSQAGGVREQTRPQDLMVTTYDVSPMGTPPGEEASEDAKRQEFLESLTHPREEAPEEKVFHEGDESQPDNKSENFGQEWFEDDFGLSRTRREAEELRLQQLQIEQEIQQLQAQQEQVPYFYLREIPNKPPPPYTPPGKPLSETPTSESEIMAITSTAVRILADELAKGKSVGEIEPSWDYYGNAGSEHVKCYKFFLFDLAKHIIGEVIEQQEKKEEVLPWMRTRERLSKYKYRKIDRTLECLNEFVQKQVSILFGFGRKMAKESLIVKWVKKKRDHVDEVLVGESQEEEAQWTQYDEDQVTVKNEVAAAILDALLEDTAQVVNVIFNNKVKRDKKK